MRALRGRQARGFRLSRVFGLVARFQPAHDRQDMLGSHASRKPGQEQNSPSRLVFGDFGATGLHQPRPSDGMPLFRRRQLFENVGARRILLGPGKRAVQRNAVLFLEVVLAISAKIAAGGRHKAILRIGNVISPAGVQLRDQLHQYGHRRSHSFRGDRAQV